LEEEVDMSEEAFIYEAIRTPRGKQKNGSLTEVKPLNLVVGLIDELRSRFPDLDENLISDVILGCVSPVGDQGADIARTAVIAAGMPDTVGGVQLNRFCASGLEAVNTAAQKVRSGWDDLVIAGGVESMSRVPMGSDGGAMFTDPATVFDNFIVPQGIGADLIATIEGFAREDVDTYALRSQERAAAAWSGGYFAKSVVPVRDQNGLVILDHDEHMRPETTMEGLAKLKPAFEGLAAMAGFDDVALQKYHWLEEINHVHTGGNSSGIVDGAALVLIGNEKAGKSQGLTPRARIVATATSGAEPTIMLTGPTPATKKVLDRAGLTIDDIDLFELNEAFASVVLKFQKDLSIPDEKLNVNGGAIAMGHPLGATGAMIAGTMVDELERRNARRALITLCIGGGMGVATIIERV
jgi:acetyl-CoA C-acetyltransferase